MKRTTRLLSAIKNKSLKNHLKNRANPTMHLISGSKKYLISTLGPPKNGRRRSGSF
jgi:hypothetical protein